MGRKLKFGVFKEGILKKVSKKVSNFIAKPFNEKSYDLIIKNQVNFLSLGSFNPFLS